jgi:hypothetical protein
LGAQSTAPAAAATANSNRRFWVKFKPLVTFLRGGLIAGPLTPARIFKQDDFLLNFFGRRATTQVNASSGNRAFGREMTIKAPRVSGNNDIR